MFAGLVIFALGQTWALDGAAAMDEARAQDAGEALAAADLFAIASRCGGKDASEESLALIRKHAAWGGTHREGRVAAFEESPLFIYALLSSDEERRPQTDASPPGGARAPRSPPRFRRLFLLKPSTIVVEDRVGPWPAGASGSTVGSESPWLFRTSGAPRVEGRGFRAMEGTTEILGETLLPDGASPEGTSSSRAARATEDGGTGGKTDGKTGGGTDGGTDAGKGVGTDAGRDAGMDAGTGGETDGGTEHGVRVLAPPGSGPTRFLHVFHIRPASEKDAVDAGARATLAKGSSDGGALALGALALGALALGALELTVTTEWLTFRLVLPPDPSDAGEIEVGDIQVGDIQVGDPGGPPLLPRRLLPSGLMPHGPEGVRLLERWDAPYRGGRTPGWDVGRPSSALVAALEDGTLLPGRAIELGCGSGTNAIYLATRGFDVTAVDVAPSALAAAQEKARKAGVEVRWILADVLALPAMDPFDLIFDRGCYHHVRQYDAAGYAEAARRLSRPGTLLFILAGSDRQTGGGGPPRVKEEEIRGDFAASYEVVWLRDTRFDRPDADAGGAPARSALLRRKAAP